MKKLQKTAETEFEGMEGDIRKGKRFILLLNFLQFSFFITLFILNLAYLENHKHYETVISSVLLALGIFYKMVQFPVIFFLKQDKLMAYYSTSTVLQIIIIGFLIYQVSENHMNICIHEMGVTLALLFLLFVMLIMEYFGFKYLIQSLNVVRHTSSLKIAFQDERSYHEYLKTSIKGGSKEI